MYTLTAPKNSGLVYSSKYNSLQKRPAASLRSTGLASATSVLLYAVVVLQNLRLVVGTRCLYSFSSSLRDVNLLSDVFLFVLVQILSDCLWFVIGHQKCPSILPFSGEVPLRAENHQLFFIFFILICILVSSNDHSLLSIRHQIHSHSAHLSFVGTEQIKVNTENVLPAISFCLKSSAKFADLLLIPFFLYLFRKTNVLFKCCSSSET